MELSESPVSLGVSVYSPQKLQFKSEILLIWRNKVRCPFRTFSMFLMFLTDCHNKWRKGAEHSLCKRITRNPDPGPTFWLLPYFLSNFFPLSRRKQKHFSPTSLQNCNVDSKDLLYFVVLFHLHLILGTLSLSLKLTRNWNQRWLITRLF